MRREPATVTPGIASIWGREREGIGCWRWVGGGGGRGGGGPRIVPTYTIFKISLSTISLWYTWRKYAGPCKVAHLSIVQVEVLMALYDGDSDSEIL